MYFAIPGAGTTVALAVRVMKTAHSRPQRVQQRLAEAYLELLKLVEREGQWVQQGIEHLEASAYDKYDFVNAFQVRTVSEPTKMDAVTMVAIVAAFGSQSVRECHKAWRMAVDDIDLEHRILQWNWEQNGDPEALITLDEQKKLQSELKPLELTTRQALADAIGAELNESLLPRR